MSAGSGKGTSRRRWDPQHPFAKRVAAELHRRKATVAWLAREMGWSYSGVSRVLNGWYAPSWRFRMAAAQALGWPPEGPGPLRPLERRGPLPWAVERIQEAMRRRGLGTPQVARATGMPELQLQRILAGRARLGRVWRRRLYDLLGLR